LSKKIVVLVGPTAAGKTALALRLARVFPVEVVGADSMQIYRGMDIGTAKPTLEERDRVPHHLIDRVYPDEAFHAGRYREEADQAVREIHGRGNVPLVVGGTGLYVKALLHGLFHEPRGTASASWQERLAAYRRFGTHPHEVLARLDPPAARAIHPNDRVRAERALDVLERTGMSITELRGRHRFREKRYDALVVGLCPERGELYRRIDLRVDRMVRTGLLDEVAGLLRLGYAQDLPSMRGLGYRHMTCVLDGSWTMETALETLKRDTRRYAKRQHTWFRHQESVTWVHEPDPLYVICETIQRFLARPIKEIV
jgi:tRNA dimethylallyltransferase